MLERTDLMVDVLMNRRSVLFALAAFVVAAGGHRLQGSLLAQKADHSIDLAKVPEKVKEAASKAAPGVKWASASKSEEDGEVVYELDGEDASKRYVYAHVTAAAKVNEVAFEIAIGKVPPVVTAALKKKAPKFQVEKAYEAHLDGKVFRYDVEGKWPGDTEETELLVSLDGRKVEFELAKVPHKVKEAASKAAPGVEWETASKSEEDGEIVYELDGEDASKRYVYAHISADATVNEVAFEIAIEKVPPVVTAALKKRFPAFRVEKAYEAHQNGKVFRYDFEGKRPRDKEEIEVYVSADGTDVKIEEN
jgi:hypothetical protein